jgi:hypothetical protein
MPHPDPEMRNPATGQGGRAISQANFNTDDIATEPTKLQARRLISRFGFAYETAVAISALAFGVAR